MSWRLVAFALGAGMYRQLVGAGLIDSLSILQVEILVIVTEADLGTDRQMSGHRLTHRLDDAVDGIGLLEQDGAPLALVHCGGRAAKVEIDPR